MNFRVAPGQVVAWLDTAAPFSNFLYIDQHFGSLPVLRRIFSIARKLGYQSLLVENILEGSCSLFQEDNKALKDGLTNFSKSLVRRYSFFSCPKDTSNPEEHFLGYAIVKRNYVGNDLQRQYVYECVLKQARTSRENNYVHCEKPFSVHTAVGKCSVKGVLYAQQDGVNFACAHVALRTVISSSTGTDITYSEINQIAGLSPGEGGSGLGVKSISAVLSAKKLSHETIKNLRGGSKYPGEFQRDLYGFIESGGAAMLGFEVNPRPKDISNHIIPVFGHTFNEDTWVPEAKRSYFRKSGAHYSSEAWLSTYIAHDDNFGPYFCLPRHYLKKSQFRLLVGIDRFKTESHAIEIESVGFDYLRHLTKTLSAPSCPWYGQLLDYVKSGLVVLRTFMVSRTEYVWHLRNLECRDGVKLEPALLQNLENHLPDYFWVVEVTAPELFSATRRKFGDVLLSATATIPKDFSSVLAARLPGKLVQIVGKKFEATDSAVISHTELIGISGR